VTEFKIGDKVWNPKDGMGCDGEPESMGIVYGFGQGGGVLVRCRGANMLWFAPQPYLSKPSTGPWLQTFLGKQLRLPEMNAEVLCLDEIAAVLSRINRFGARTKLDYTVAEHCVKVADCVKALGGTLFDQWEAIHHEDDEALLGFDPPSPMLTLLPDLKVLKKRACINARRRFNLPGDTIPAIVKEADMILLATEKRDLMLPAPVEWMPMPEPLSATITPCANPKGLFVQRWRDLAEAVGYIGD